MSRPRVLLLAGYFDWFSGYQETGLARWLSRYAATEVVAGDRVSPMFNDAHLASLGITRNYATGTSEVGGVAVTRFPSVELRSMVWSTSVRRYIESRDYDLILQVMPGQVMPLAGTLAKNDAVRAVLYGDNSAMWSHLSPQKRILKWLVFAVTKGMLYRFVNRRADLLYGYTPETTHRLEPFSGRKRLQVLPLGFDPERFRLDAELRRTTRRDLGYAAGETVLISAGKFQAKKRLDLLLDAFSALASRDDRLRLLLVGADDSESSAAITHRVENDPLLHSRVQLHGFVDSEALNGLFNAADVGVWPRMPAITIQQAMGTGLRVVLPRNEWVGHLIRPGSGAYFDQSLDGFTQRLGEAISSQTDPPDTAQERETRAKANSWLSSEGLALSILRSAGLTP